MPLSLSCPGCHVPLSVCQPEDGDPDRLLGSCPQCREWFEIRYEATAGGEISLQVGGRLVAQSREGDVTRLAQ
jgi:hypothetical protein